MTLTWASADSDAGVGRARQTGLFKAPRMWLARRDTSPPAYSIVSLIPSNVL